MLFYAQSTNSDGHIIYHGFKYKSQREWFVAAHSAADARPVSRYDVVLKCGKDFTVDDDGTVRDRFGKL